MNAMKYFSKLIGILAAAALFAGCQQEEVLEPGTFKIDMDEYSVIALDQNAQVAFIPVKTNITEDQWSFTSTAAWCKVGRSIGAEKGIMVSVDDNTDKESKREAKVTVSAGSNKYEMSVIQTGYGPAIIVKNASIGPEGGELQLDVVSNVELNTALACAPDYDVEDGVNWITSAGDPVQVKAFATTRFIYNIDVNEMPVERKATVKLHATSSSDSKADTQCIITQSSISVTSTEVFSDEQVKALSVRASQVSSYEGPVENLIDGSYQSYYHSPYEVTTNFPVTLEFEFFGDQRIDYINVMHRGTTSGGVFYPGGHWRGQFGTVKIYYKVNAGDPYTYLQDYNFGGNGGYQTVNLVEPLNNVTWIKFEVLDDADPNHVNYSDGQYVTCGEVEFYNTNRGEVNDWIQKVFTDMSCSEIKKGVTKKDIIQMNAVSPYLATNVAMPLLLGTYNESEKEFRIHSYEPYSDNHINLQLVTQYYTAMDNPTGIEVQEGKDILVCVDQIPAGQSVSLAVYGEESEFGPNYGGGGQNESYEQNTPLQPGVNTIRIQKTGMAYVMNTAASLSKSSKPVKVHILPGCGQVQGYFDPSFQSDERYQELLSRCSYKYFVVKGTKCMFLFHTNQLRTDFPKSIRGGIEAWDNLVKWELELMGLDKHPEFNNHMMAVTNTNPDIYMNATNRRVQFNANTINWICDPESLKIAGEGAGVCNIWGPAHEMGHVNQMAINWRGCTESSNNVFSNYANMKLSGDDYYKTRWSRGAKLERLAADYVQGKPWVLLGSSDHMNEDTDLHMRMNWQLWNYFQNCGYKKDFFPALFEYFRNGHQLPNADGPKYGRSEDLGTAQLEYYEACCVVSGMDLTDFFDAWGFFRTVDTQYEQYGKAYYGVTTAMINASKARVRDMNLPKAGPLQYLEDRLTFGGEKYADMGYWELFKNKTKIAGTPKASVNGNKVTLSDYDGVVAIEVRNGTSESGELLYFANVSSFTCPVSLTGRTLWAVQYDGVRKKVTVQ